MNLNELRQRHTRVAVEIERNQKIQAEAEDYFKKAGLKKGQSPEDLIATKRKEIEKLDAELFKAIEVVQNRLDEVEDLVGV